MMYSPSVSTSLIIVHSCLAGSESLIMLRIGSMTGAGAMPARFTIMEVEATAFES